MLLAPRTHKDCVLALFQNSQVYWRYQHAILWTWGWRSLIWCGLTQVYLFWNQNLDLGWDEWEFWILSTIKVVSEYWIPVSFLHMRLGESGLSCWCAVIPENCQSVRFEGLSCTLQVTPYSDPWSGALEYSWDLFRSNRVSAWWLRILIFNVKSVFRLVYNVGNFWRGWGDESGDWMLVKPLTIYATSWTAASS